MSSSRDRTDPAKVLRIPTPRVFLPLLRAQTAGSYRYFGVHGGRSGGKSHFVAEMVIERCLQNRRIRVVVVREFAISTKQSFMALLEDKIQAWGVEYAFRVLENMIHVRCPRTGRDLGRIVFRGMQSFNATSIKSLEGFDLAVVEEAQEISLASWEMLYPTIRKPGSQIWCVWNPDQKTDAVDAFFRSPEAKNRKDLICVEVLWSDNPFLSDESRKDMEYDKARDLDRWNHIWQGGYNTKSRARVFNNFRLGTREEMDAARARIEVKLYGGDFGFATDPAVLVELGVEERRLYVFDEAYGIGVPTDYLPFLFAGPSCREMKKCNPVAHAELKPEHWEWKGIPGCWRFPIIADSARPETIDYLNRHGFPLMEGAIKGAGSVIEGVEFIKSYDVIIDPDNCPHTLDEFMNYCYKVDKKSGIVLPVLEDKKNHVIDASRYALENERKARGGMW